MRSLLQSLILLFIAGPALLVAPQEPASGRDAGYVLGPEDQLAVRVLELEEFNAQNLPPVRIDLRGNIALPLVGRIHVAGLTVEQLETEIARRLLNVMQEPEVTVAVA